MAFSFSYISRELDGILPPPTETAVESRAHFSFDGTTGTFRANGIARDDHDRLMALLFPSKDWFISQLRHYGIPFRPGDPVPKLRATLEDAVKEGKCKKVPEHIQNLENDLRRQYVGQQPQPPPPPPQNGHGGMQTGGMDLCSPMHPQFPPVAAKPLTNNLETSNNKRPVEDILPTFTSTGDLFKDATGSYEIECFDIGADDQALHLSILLPENGALSQPLGAFDFHVVSGLMKFTAKESSVGKFRTDDVDDDFNQEDSLGSRGGGKRKADAMQSRRKRARRSIEAPKRRLYFQWQGKGSTNGFVMQVHEQQVGYLDFDDDACSSFTGVASFPGLGERVKFVGYKVAKETAMLEPFL